MKHPVISLHQPYATWVIEGIKTIETRLHNRFECLVGRRVYIHATKKYTSGAYREAIDLGHDIEIGEFELPQGVILGSVEVLSSFLCTPFDSHEACIDCEIEDRFGLRLANPIKCSPIPINGKQGIWYYEFKPIAA